MDNHRLKTVDLLSGYAKCECGAEFEVAIGSGRVKTDLLIEHDKHLEDIELDAFLGTLEEGRARQ